MASRNLIVVGASAGGVDALKGLVHHLPADLPACILVVLHVAASFKSYLPDILRRYGPLPVKQAETGDPIESGQRWDRFSSNAAGMR